MLSGLINLISNYLVGAAEVRVADAVNLGRMSGFTDYNNRFAEDSPQRVVVYQWSALLDMNTCPVCRWADGLYFSATDPLLMQIWPPVHRACRCMLVGILQEEWQRYTYGITRITPQMVAYLTQRRYWFAEDLETVELEESCNGNG